MIALLTKFKLAAIVAGVLGVLGASGGAAYVAAAHGAMPFAPSALASHVTASAGRGGKAAGAGRLAHVVRGTVVIASGGAYVTRTLDVGTVSALSSSSLSIARADGTTAIFAVNGATQYGRARHAPKDPSKLVGRRVVVLSEAGTAVEIGGGGALRGAVYADLFVERKGGLVEVQIARGVVQAISSTSLTILRPDGVTTTGALSARTKWGNARRPLSQSDVHTGMTVTIVVVKGQIAHVGTGAAPAPGV